jgi:hypothetical protein
MRGPKSFIIQFSIVRDFDSFNPLHYPCSQMSPSCFFLLFYLRQIYLCYYFFSSVGHIHVRLDFGAALVED